MNRYESAKAIYAALGVDTDAAIQKLKTIPVALHCWQGDDVTGFDHDGPLTGGIQTTGNYPGKAKTPEQLMADMDKAMSLCPGKKKLNLHACYAIFEPGEFVDRDKLDPNISKNGWNLPRPMTWALILILPFLPSQGKRRPDSFQPRRRNPSLLGRARQGLYPYFSVFC